MDNGTILLRTMTDLMWSQRDLASRLGVTRRTVNRYINHGAPDRIIYAVQWVYFIEMGRTLK